MTPIGITRFCPYHGGYVKLARCPVVATSAAFNQDAQMRRGRTTAPGPVAPEEDLDLDLGFDDVRSAGPRAPAHGPAAGDAIMRDVPGAMGPQKGQLLRSKVDNRDRIVLALAPGLPSPPPVASGRRRVRIRPAEVGPEVELPSLVDLAGGREGLRARPARACPECWHPFPVTIDQRNPYPVALIGHAAASKTTTVLALIESVAQNGAAVLGVRSFAATQQTMEALSSDDKEIFANYREGIGPGGTNRTHHPPLEFLTSLPGRDRQVTLLIQDAAGEDLMDEETRTYRTFLWADVVIFIYNPEASPSWRRNKGFDQAVLLNDVRSDIEAYGQHDASGEPFPEPKLIIAVSKADLLDDPPDLRGGPRPEAEVKQAIIDLRDAAMIGAAERWNDVHWFFTAPLPAHGGGSEGVTDLFAHLLTLLKP